MWIVLAPSGRIIAAIARAKPILLAAAMAFLALNVWTGSPLLAVWLGSKVQGEESQPSMGAYAVVILSLCRPKAQWA